MDLPKPPEDLDLKNIIDKLANFVARNGPEFEQMTKQKQKDNPRFSFLFGGEYFNYYQCKVTTEQAIINQQKQKLAQQQALVQQVITQQNLQGPPWQQKPPQQLPGNQGFPPTSLNPQLGPGPGPGPGHGPGPGLGPNQSLGPSQGLPPSLGPPGMAAGPGPNPGLQQQISSLEQQIQQHQSHMAEQIKQSESNLAAQYQSLTQQQQHQIDEAITASRDEKLQQLCEECEMKMEELDRTVQPIIDSCTKDSILHGKNWLMVHCVTQDHCNLISQYLLKRITSKEASFNLRLHLIYLINDLLHHCQRKNADELKRALERVVVPIFCAASLGVDEERRIKLTKLLALWDANKYFDSDTIELMKSPSQSLSNYQASLITDNAQIVTQVTAKVQTQYGGLQKQHQDFVNHLNTQLTQMQSQLKTLQHQLQQQQTAAVSTAQSPGLMHGQSSTQMSNAPSLIQSAPNSGDPTLATSLPQVNIPPPSLPQTSPATPEREMRMDNAPPGQGHPHSQQQMGLGSGPPMPGPGMGPGPPFSAGFNQPPPPFNTPPMGFNQRPPPQQFDYGHGLPQHGPPPGHPDFRGPPPAGPMPPMPLPDLSKPPPGFPALPPGPPILPIDMDLTPSVPYYELPAGLMAPLVKLEDNEYKSLDPNDIRLPPPMPPSERLLAAVEAFYSHPTHERPRDSEGWEKLGLYEFFKAKQRAKKMKEQHMAENQSQFEEQDIPRARSRSPEIKREQSPSPPRRRRRYNSGERKQRSRSHSRSRSRSRSNSPLPYLRSSRSPTPQEPAPPPRSRSPTPPILGGSFGGMGGLGGMSGLGGMGGLGSMGGFEQMGGVPDSRLGEDNKGHMLLRKMGWGGKGLGATEQGIVDPIEAGDVRDRQDMFKGIGMDMKDPFEQFRKNKSQGFIQRMKARDESRDGKGKKSKSDD